VTEDLDWTENERGAVENFMASSGPLRSALEKFTAFHARRQKDCCAMHMATVPRNPEMAADYAAKAQFLGEFWELLAQAAISAERV
jgi:hypothetical protein